MNRRIIALNLQGGLAFSCTPHLLLVMVKGRKTPTFWM
jgi:hypothetical protein